LVGLHSSCTNVLPAASDHTPFTEPHHPSQEVYPLEDDSGRRLLAKPISGAPDQARLLRQLICGSRSTLSCCCVFTPPPFHGHGQRHQHMQGYATRHSGPLAICMDVGTTKCCTGIQQRDWLLHKNSKAISYPGSRSSRMAIQA